MAEKTTVLCIDDDEAMREAYEAFTPDTFNVITTENGKTGLERLVTLDPSRVILFTDFDMPGMTGLEVARTVRTNPQYANYNNIPIIGITGMEHDWEGTVTAELKKPLMPSTMRETLLQYAPK